MAVKKSGDPAPRRPPAKTPEAREIQLQHLAYNLAEKRLLDESASAQEIVYLLKAGSARDKLEMQRLKNDALLIEQKIGAAEEARGQDQLLRDAMAAFTTYIPTEAPPDIELDGY